MDLRDRTGAVSPAEGCMFFAMFLFAALLVALIVLAFFRFQERPNSDEIVPPASYRSGPMGYQLSAISYQSSGLIADS